MQGISALRSAVGSVGIRSKLSTLGNADPRAPGSVLQATRRLAPYWRKGYVAPKMELSDMAERLAELAGKPAAAARAAGATYEDAMGYSESQVGALLSP